MRLRVGFVACALTCAGVARADDAPEDVMVRGRRGDPGSDASESLARAEVRQLPGAFGDPFRAVEAMPGMTPVISGLPYFYVRGAPPGNVGYYFDGVRVPYLFHFGLGPAVIHPGLIAKTELHRGGYPAQLGRYSGGMIESSSMPPSDRLPTARLRFASSTRGCSPRRRSRTGEDRSSSRAAIPTPRRSSPCSNRTRSSPIATTRSAARSR